MHWREVEAFLDRRRGLLDGVVFSGGEPTLHRALPGLAQRVRDAGFQTGLHSAGIYPSRLRAVLPRLDWLGLDIKAPWARYDDVTGVPGSAESAARSLAEALDAGVDLECRTTWHAGLFPFEELLDLAGTLARAGTARWVLQRCSVGGVTQPGPDATQLALLRERLPGTALRG
jgi:pyruvate formate lyase activating enzyme